MRDGIGERDGAFRPLRILLLGGSGTIGRATLGALVDAGHAVTCLLRPRPANIAGGDAAAPNDPFPAGAVLRFGDATESRSLVRDAFAGERFDTLVSCLASRTGRPGDARKIDRDANIAAFAAAKAAGVRHVVLLSAICVQKPRLAFQHAKLDAEAALIASGLDYSIVRPTAFFKSLSGQVARVAAGKRFVLFGDGRLTACKPISDGDLARFIARCVVDPGCRNRILPIGGPGPAATPRDQGEMLFALLCRSPRFRHVPVALLDTVIGTLGLLGRIVPRCADMADLARIGRYYATESMLLMDPATGRYDAAATPSTGSETLTDHYASLLRTGADAGLGDHAVLARRRR